MGNGIIAEIIGLLGAANYETELLNEKRNKVRHTLMKRLRQPGVTKQKELLICPHQATRTPNEEKTGKCRQCGRNIKAN